MPDHRLIGLDGQALPADELRQGRVLFVYLTTNCEPCIKEVEVISRLHRDARSALRIYGISIDRPAQINTFIEEFDLKFPIFVDENARLAKSLDIHHFPSKYYVEDGVITKIWRGRTKDEATLRHELSIE
jgi:peroxiredoxin